MEILAFDAADAPRIGVRRRLAEDAGRRRRTHGKRRDQTATAWKKRTRLLWTLAIGVAGSATALPASHQPQERPFSGIPARREREKQEQRRQQIRDRLATARRRGGRRSGNQRERGRAEKQPTWRDRDGHRQNDTRT
jgi:hypothetical protein